MPLSTDEINRWDEALRQATGSARQLATALEGIKQSAGSVAEGLSSVTAVNRELVSGLQNVQNSAGQAGTEISAIGSHHSELTTLFVENGKKQQESLTQIAENTKKTTKTIGEEAAKSTGNITKEFVALSQMLGADGDGPFMQLATNFSAAALSVGTLGEEFQKLNKAQSAAKALEATGNSAKRLGGNSRSAGAGTAALTGALSMGAMAFGPWGLAAAGVIAIGGTLISRFQQVSAEAQELKEAIKLEDGLGENSITALADKMMEDDLPALLDRAGVSTRTFTQALNGNGKASQELSNIQKRNSDRLIEIGEILDETIDLSSEHRQELQEEQRALIDKSLALSDITRLQDGYSETLQDGKAKGREYHSLINGLTEASSENGNASRDLAGRQLQVNDAMAEGVRQAQDLKTALEDMTGSNISAAEAEMSFHEAVEKASSSVEKNGQTLDSNTEKGRENHRALIDLAEATMDQTSAMQENGASSEDMIAQYELGRAEFIKVARQMGLTGSAANDLANEYLGIPAAVKNQIEVTATGRWDYTMGGSWHGGGALNGHGSGGLATGGPVHGPGTATSDSIPVWLSDGEYVQRASSVDYYGTGFMTAINERRIPKGELPGFAKGGRVSWSSTGTHRDPWGRIDEQREDVRIGIQRMHHTATNDIGSTYAEMFKRLVGSGGPVVAAARSQLGVPYSWGGGGIHGPSTGFGRGAGIRGFDCSSLMQYAWWQGAGVRLPRVTYDQINTGRAVRKGSEVPGDLVFPHRGHVAMVAGPGRLIHTPYTGASVSYRSMYPSPIAIRRPSRFDTGGIWGSGTVGVNESGRPERVLSPRQTRAFEQLVDGVLSGHRTPVASVGRGSTADRPLVGTVNVNHVPGYSTPRDVLRALDHARRTARLARPR